MNNENQVVTGVDCVVHTSHRRLSWSAIFAGAFIGVGLGFLLQLYGMAIGLSAYSSSPNGAMVLAAGGLLGMLVGGIAAMLAAGYATGYLARCPDAGKHMGIIYGFTMWTVALTLSAIMYMPVSHYVATYTKHLAPAGNAVAQKVMDMKKASGQSADNSVNSTANNKKMVPVTSQDMAWSAWIVFALFFAGAFSASLGAHWGMCCCKSGDENIQ